MKTFHLNETDLEWSLKHLLRFYSSDFFPKEFEFEAIKADWPRIKEHLIGQDIAAYGPKTPLTRLPRRRTELSAPLTAPKNTDYPDPRYR